ncbi:MAG: flavodoxin domain-containing protein [Myxococcota bacterium]
MPAIPILCGSETGNAEYCADMLSAALDSEGFESEVIDMMAFDGPSIAHHPLVFIVTSTYGNGGPPSNAEELLAYLQTSAIDLSAVRFAVCGLGSHTFDRFAQCGKDFEAAMLKAGATQVFDRVDCDDDYEEGYGKFEASALSYLQEHGLSSPGAASVPRVAPTPTPAPRETTAQAPLVAKRLLSRSGSKKETMHYELDLSNVAMNYEVGDCFAIHAINSRNAIQEVIDSAGLRSDDAVEFGGATTTLEKALERSCLLQCTDALFEHVAERGTPGAAARAQRAKAVGTPYGRTVRTGTWRNC